MLAELPNVLVVPPAKGWKTTSDLVNAAKAEPGKLSYGSAGTGSGTHMNAEKFRLRAGFDAVHVPYKGPPEGLTDIMGNRIDFMFAPIISAISLIRDGRVTTLAVGSAKRSTVLPDVPTTEEAGYPDAAYRFWVGMLTPSGTPPAVIERLNTEVRQVLATPEIKQRLAALGADAAPMTPVEFDRLIARELVENAALAREAGINPQ
jgi:tripartite-type tricarboxylate transporter receptor subunit TctC